MQQWGRKKWKKDHRPASVSTPGYVFRPKAAESQATSSARSRGSAAPSLWVRLTPGPHKLFGSSRLSEEQLFRRDERRRSYPFVFSPGLAAVLRILGPGPAWIITFHLLKLCRGFPWEMHSSSMASMIQNINTLWKAVFYAWAAKVLFPKRKSSCNSTITLIPSSFWQTFIKQLLSTKHYSVLLSTEHCTEHWGCKDEQGNAFFDP